MSTSSTKDQEAGSAAVATNISHNPALTENGLLRRTKGEVGTNLRRGILTAAAAGIVVGLAGLAFAAQTKVETGKPVVSRDKSRMVAVDREFPVVEGELDRFSGRMIIRVTDSGGTTTQQRIVEASQVRLLQPPRWLDNQWTAFSYNVSKNANGVVYLDADGGSALQVEFVATSRRMGATNKVETELTALDVTEYKGKPQRLRNLVFGGGSVFPIYLKKLPAYANEPFATDFLADLRAGISAYRDFLKAHKLDGITLEQGSESFSPDESAAASLACAGGQPVVLIVSLKAASAKAALEKAGVGNLGAEIKLVCSIDTPDDDDAGKPGDPKPDATSDFDRFRFVTSWKDNQTVLVEKEVFETEEEAPHKEALYSVTLDGKVSKLEVAPSVPAKKPAGN
ncbi:MAG: hypothetical protein K1X53_14215 [Candidatus Sumerlaeaceae bacterium]|nr:hypothetical protein [Candidatus Sumerlaeaceae bacterium]